MMPKLRKENVYLESELNSTLQTFLYDFLYDQQELYDYYDDCFYQKEEDPDLEIKIRNPELPFSSLIFDTDKIVSQEFGKSSDALLLAKIRWYSFDEISDFQYLLK